MKHNCNYLLLALVALLPATLSATTVVTPGDPNNIPGVNDFAYDHYYALGDDHTAIWTSDSDAYSWDHPNLASANPALGNQTGWTNRVLPEGESEWYRLRKTW